MHHVKVGGCALYLSYVLGTLRQAQGTPSNDGTFAELVEAIGYATLTQNKSSSHLTTQIAFKSHQTEQKM